MSDLGEWQARVEAFGGRVGRGGRDALWSELEKSNLGSFRSLPTSQVAPSFPPIVTLAEMKLSAPVEVDVSFAYTNLFVAGDNPLATPGLNQGNGFVRITWGTPGSVQQVAEVDGNRGWRYPFVASFLRVDYIPVDPLSSPAWALAGGQQRDLGIQAMISPASGAPCQPLTKTVFLNDIVPLGFSVGVVPKWAHRFRVAGSIQQDATGTWRVQLFDSSFVVVGATLANAVAANFPSWVGVSSDYPVPQTAQLVNYASLDAATSIVNPSVIFELAL